MSKLVLRLVLTLIFVMGCRSTPPVRDYVEFPDSETTATVPVRFEQPDVHRNAIQRVGFEASDETPETGSHRAATTTRATANPHSSHSTADSLRDSLDSGKAMSASGFTVPLYDDSCKMASHEVACAAARNATLGNALQQHLTTYNNSCRDDNCDNACSREVRTKILSYRSIYDRNNAASKALMLFYGLAEIDQQLLLISKASRELRRNEKRVDALRDEDLEIPFDATELTRSRVELNNKSEELKLKKSQANRQLLVLINDACSRDHLTPSVDRDIPVFSVDADAAVQEAMSLRSDLGLLQMLNHCLNDHTLAATNQALKLTSAALGYAECPPTLRDLLRLACRGAEPVEQNQVANRRAQIQALESDLRRQIDSEVRSAVVEIETRMRQVALARENVASWNKRIDDLHVLRELEKATPFEITNATLQRITAESELIHKISQVRMATVKLATSQGRLATDCGYVLPSPWCCCNRSSDTARGLRRKLIRMR